MIRWLGFKAALLSVSILCLAPALARADAISFSATSMTGTIARGQERTILRGQARLQSAGLVIEADHIELYGQDFRYAECRGRVRLVDSDRGLRLETEQLFYDRELKLARLTGPSSLEDSQNQLVIRGNFIENDETRNLVLIQVNVRIFKDDLVCRAEFVRYNRDSGLLELSGSPSVSKGADSYRASRITINLNTDEIQMDGQVAGSIIQEAGR